MSGLHRLLIAFTASRVKMDGRFIGSAAGMMMRRTRFLLGMLILALLWATQAVSAHANLQRSSPAPNSAMEFSPPEIRLWFTEPLEADFSRVTVRDQTGVILNLPVSQVDPADPMQMVLRLPQPLPDGVYTVVWRTLSAADGHPTLGSFPFAIGDASQLGGAVASSDDSIPLDGTLARWVNLISLALGVGGISFFLFVWSPSAPEPIPTIERRIHRLLWLGWVMIGISGFLLLLLQYALATNSSLLTEWNGAYLNSLIANTRFGQLWLGRMALWFGMGGALWFARNDPFFYSVALVLGGAIALINSLFSHANAVFDVTAAIAVDWVHLMAMVMWVGGLFYFVAIIGPILTGLSEPTRSLSGLVARFSNFARVAVAALIVTGIYSGWLQVGSVEGLLTTAYGQTLLVKIILIVPVLGLAFINLLFTHRGLQAGQVIWGARLRGLVGAEIMLTLGILVTVGMMTSSSPARNTLAQRAANPPAPAPAPIKDVQTANEMLIQLDITPGWVGENSFSLKLVDQAGNPINDARLIRMRFESQTQNLGESELRPVLSADGTYTIAGANLSVPGDWRIRLTIQRPDRFDTVIDFRPTVPAAPSLVIAPPPPAPNEPLPNRIPILLLAGALALGLGGFFIGESRARLWQASSLLALGLVLVGGLLLFSALQAVPATALAAAPEYVPADDAPVRLAVNSNLERPYFLNQDGRIMQPDDQGGWRALALDAVVHDFYVDMQKVVWAATDQGFYAYRDEAWTRLSDRPARRLVLTHGFFFALGEGHITRVEAGNFDQVRELDAPLPDQPAHELVMLGNHSHVLHNGDQLYQTFDLGLSWKLLPSPVSIERVWVDAAYNLLGTSADGIFIWQYTNGALQQVIPLPDAADSTPLLRVFNETLYAVSVGQVYRLAGESWERVTLTDDESAYFIALEYQYPHTLWAVDAEQRVLYSTEDGLKWRPLPISRR